MAKYCVSPPEIDEKHLLMYLDGEADDQTSTHLKRCSYCRERAADLDRFQKRLTRQIYRVTCPPSIELGQFHQRMLPASQKLIIAQHVSQCPHCTRELAELEKFLSRLEPSTGLQAPLRTIIARLIGREGPGQDANDPHLAPLFAGLRGGEEPFIFHAENIRIVIDVQKDAEQPELKVIIGLVTGLESGEFIVQASQAGQIIATSRINQIGNFLIPHLKSGIYELTLLGSSLEIRILSFTV